MVSVEERLSNSDQGEEIKPHRAPILWTLKEQNSSFKVIFGSKSPQHSNINFKFPRVKIFCSVQKCQSFQKNYDNVFKNFKHLNIGKRDKEIFIQKATSKFPRQQALGPLQGWASSREAWKTTLLKEHKSNKNQIWIQPFEKKSYSEF